MRCLQSYLHRQQGGRRWEWGWGWARKGISELLVGAAESCVRAINQPAPVRTLPHQPAPPTAEEGQAEASSHGKHADPHAGEAPADELPAERGMDGWAGTAHEKQTALQERRVG